MSAKQPEALRLAEVLDLLAMDMKTPRQAATELRRLHTENADLSDQCLQSVLAISALNDEIGRITEQRDELLAALQACHEAMGYMSEYDIPLTLPEQVKAAIAKAIGC